MRLLLSYDYLPQFDKLYHLVAVWSDTARSIQPNARSQTTQTVTFTMSTQDLFSADLLSPSVQAELPEGYKLRALRSEDYEHGFLDCLRVLTTVGDISRQEFDERYQWLAKQDGTYFILVIEDTNFNPPRIVGTGALIVERKL